MSINTKQFSHEFMIVSNHYLLDELGELEAAKEAVRADPMQAAISYSAMAKDIMLNG